MPPTSIPRNSMSAIRPMISKRTAPAPGVRSLSQLTMGFEEIQRWKEWNFKKLLGVSPNDTVFDFKLYTPIIKSEIWNIDHSESSKESPPPPQSVSPIPRRIPKLRLPPAPEVCMFTGIVLGSKRLGQQTGRGSSTTHRAAFSTTKQYITFKTLKSLNQEGRVGSQTAKVQKAVRDGQHAAVSADDKKDTGKGKENNQIEELPVPRNLPYSLGSGGSF